MKLKRHGTSFDRFLLREVMPSLYHSPLRPLTPLLTSMWYERDAPRQQPAPIAPTRPAIQPVLSTPATVTQQAA